VRDLAGGAGRSGRLGGGEGHVLEARALVERTIALIESAFAPEGRRPGTS